MDESERIAPVIPLFGGPAAASSDRFGATVEHEAVAVDAPESGAVGENVEDVFSHRTGDGAWRSTWDASSDRSATSRVADAGRPSDRHPARGGLARSAPRLRALQSPDAVENAGDGPDPAEIRESAEELLVRKLRARSLSISEAQMVLKGVEVQGHRLDAAQIDDVIDDFCRRGYLDDAVLAAQLVTSGVERKKQGRVAVSRALAQRGLSRDVIDAALDELPDDDIERALEFARTKMRSLARLDPETAKRRLTGQLARRGYPGGVVSNVVRTVTAEQFGGRRPSSGVRFE
ncbi:regulatory protein RecX [Microbacterium sp. OVT16B]|uniref:regulatory protein RecX n=1 Tax=Microbacterium sp. OVT16B TaxID=2862682 RepID=UPI001CBDFC38|nr:regulatory protein RecX [Microbacterium sp. OVT16B]